MIMDHYKTLGINRNASPDEIKKAYRKLAGQHHPDRGGDTALFQKIQEAYDTLSDPHKKAQYDNPSSHGPQGFPGGFPGGFSFQMNGFDFGDIFGSVFGQAQQPFHTRQNVFRTAINIALEDAYKGGSQQIRMQTQTGTKFANIDIPKGINNGDQLKFDNIIDNGILIVEFRLMPHLKFERRGNDLYANHAISILDLITGTKFEFTTVSGKRVEVNVRPKTQPNTQLKLVGEGMPIINTNMYGDQIILLTPFMPDTIDDAIIESILKTKKGN